MEIANDNQADSDERENDLIDMPIDGGEVTPSEAVPEAFLGFCLNCFYNLRSLPSTRCPECGRAFNPRNPNTYSRTPYRTLGANLKPLTSGIHEVMNEIFGSAGPASSRPPIDAPVSTEILKKELQLLRTRNAKLEHALSALANLLGQKGVLTPEEIASLGMDSGLDKLSLRDLSPETVASALAEVQDDRAETVALPTQHS